MRHILSNRRAIVAFIAPALVVYLGVIVVPAVWSLVYSFFKGTPALGFHFVGIANFRQLWTDPTVRQTLLFTIKYTVVLLTCQIVFGYLLALFYIFVLRRSSTIIRTLVFFPVVLPPVAVALLFNKLFAIAPQVGPVNSVLQLLGISPVDWFATGTAAFVVIIVMDLWRSAGFYAVLLYAGLVDIPEDVIESARIDGAGGWRLVRHIILPLSKPIVIASVIFGLNADLKVFDSILALNNGGPGTETTPLNLYMFQTSFLYNDYGYGSTIAMLITVLCLAGTVLVFRSSRRQVEREAV
ncbi:MAG TPA: sugar ABC transporter permease [Trebonia sp.]|jgi:raffinose/stachyose/melibiose transport system permease protein|nr:sugar ABC transporter permease [Trebonia sp.]